MKIIEIKNLNFRYPEQKNWLIEHANLEIEEGDFIGLTGSNGSGKSTLLKLILGFLTPQKGEIKLWGKPLRKSAEKIGYLAQFEDIDFYFPLTVFEIVLQGKATKKIIQGYSKADKESTKDILKKLDLFDLKDKNLKDLSGGQKQKVFLARALVNEPKLLILDEPLNNLDIKTQSSFYDIIKELNKDTTIIAVDHNLEILTKYANKIVCIDKCEEHTLTTHTKQLKKL